MVRWTDRPAMTIDVDLGRKATKQTKVRSLRYKPVFQFEMLLYTKRIGR